MTNEPNRTDLHRLGSEIREVRKARGFTLYALSNLVSCSVAYLSRIERGTAKVSDELLTEISAALMVDPHWFFPTQQGSGQLERQHVVRSNNRRALSEMYTRSEDELGFSDQLLSSTLSGSCYMILSRFPPGRGQPPELSEGYSFDGEQHALILSGTVEVALGEELITLNEGDSFSYPSVISHRFRNASLEHEAVMVWAMSPVRITW